MRLIGKFREADSDLVKSRTFFKLGHKFQSHVVSILKNISLIQSQLLVTHKIKLANNPMLVRSLKLSIFKCSVELVTFILLDVIRLQTNFLSPIVSLAKLLKCHLSLFNRSYTDSLLQPISPTPSFDHAHTHFTCYED